MTAKEPAEEKHCGTCSLCCKVVGVAAFGKPQGVWCSHCAPGAGCKVYESRPDECRTFACGWLRPGWLAPEWKPDIAKFLITFAQGHDGLEIRCDPSFPQAWRREPYYSKIMQWADEAKQGNRSVVICVGTRVTLVAPEGEFYLGTVSAGDVIVRDFAGGKLIGAHLKKAPSPDAPGDASTP